MSKLEKLQPATENSISALKENISVSAEKHNMNREKINHSPTLATITKNLFALQLKSEESRCDLAMFNELTRSGACRN